MEVSTSSVLCVVTRRWCYGVIMVTVSHLVGSAPYYGTCSTGILRVYDAISCFCTSAFLTVKVLLQPQ
jgi:hypothetical protein